MAGGPTNANSVFFPSKSTMAINISLSRKLTKCKQKNPEKKQPDHHLQVLYHPDTQALGEFRFQCAPFYCTSVRCLHDWETARVLQALASAKQVKAQVLRALTMSSSQAGVLLVSWLHSGLGMHLCFESNQMSEKLGQPTVTSWKNKVTADKSVHRCGGKETKSQMHVLGLQGLWYNHAEITPKL